MKNYVKVILGTKNFGIFPFEDTDEAATSAALSRAKEIASKFNGVRIAVWTRTGLVPGHLPTVGRGDAPKGWD